MKCPRCQEEVALARVCPYCGSEVPANAPDAQRRSGSDGAGNPSGRRGRFVGPIDAIDGPSERPADGRGPRGGALAGSLWDWLLLPRYLLDGSVPVARKLVLLAGVIYILAPIDLAPDFMPILGWLDDVGVGVFLWHYFRNELARYRRRLNGGASRK